VSFNVPLSRSEFFEKIFPFSSTALPFLLFLRQSVSFPPDTGSLSPSGFSVRCQEAQRPVLTSFTPTPWGVGGFGGGGGGVGFGGGGLVGGGGVGLVWVGVGLGGFFGVWVWGGGGVGVVPMKRFSPLLDPPLRHLSPNRGPRPQGGPPLRFLSTERPPPSRTPQVQFRTRAEVCRLPRYDLPFPFCSPLSSERPLRLCWSFLRRPYPAIPRPKAFETLFAPLLVSPGRCPPPPSMAMVP